MLAQQLFGFKFNFENVPLKVMQLLRLSYRQISSLIVIIIISVKMRVQLKFVKTPHNRCQISFPFSPPTPPISIAALVSLQLAAECR